MGLARALQKAGYGTRRRAETLIAQGRVKLDAEICEDPRAMAKPDSVIELDGKPLVVLPRRYFAFHKPPRVVCTAVDGGTRRLVADFLPGDVPGLAPCGRMDGKTTGLLLVSNDPVWNNLLATSPGLEEEYRVQIKGELNDLELDVISTGIQLPNMGLFRPVSMRIVEIMHGRTVLTMVIRKSKPRQIRRLFSTFRHQIILLRRIRIGDVRLGDLPVGTLTELSHREVDSLRTMAETVSARTADDPRA